MHERSCHRCGLPLWLGFLFVAGCGSTSETVNVSDVDADHDGYTTLVDCDDTDAAIHPGVAEICGDDVDQDCDGSDATCPPCGDAVVVSSGCLCGGANHTDGVCCADSWHDSGYCCDGTWQAGVCINCPDADIDGHTDAVCGGDDCNDALDSVYPGALEICDDGVDQDCSGADLVCPPDTTPPVLSAGQPSGVLTAGTTQTTLRVTTDEAATCKWSTTPDTPYADMSNTFSTTGGTSHETAVTGLTDGQSYTYYVRCEDGTGNATTADFAVSFSVGDASTYTITASAGPNGSISPSGATTVTAGDSQSFTITPSSGYQTASLTVDGSSVGVTPAYTFTNVRADHTIYAAFSVIQPSPTIASVQAACAAEPLLSGTVYYYCDCGTGADPDCVAGDDANAGTDPALPRRTVANAITRFNSMAANDTVALCQGGAFDATGSLAIGASRCSAGSTCNDLREYSPTTFSSTAKPIVNNGAASMLIAVSGDFGGARLLNLSLRGNGTNSGVFFYNGAHDVTMCNLDLDMFDLAVHNTSGGTAVNTNIKLRGSYITNSSNIAYLGGGTNADISYNIWEGNGGNTPLQHTIYLSTYGTDMTVIGNYIHGQYGPTCVGGLLMGHGSIDGLEVRDNTISVDASATTPGCWGVSYTNNTGNPNFPIHFRRTVISGNTIINGGNLGLVVSSCPDCVIENNRIIMDWTSNANVTGMSVAAYPRDAARGDDLSNANVVRNNTVWFGSGMTGTNTGIYTNTEGTGHIISNNSVTSEQTSGTLNCYRHELPLASYAFMNNNHCYGAGTYHFERTHGSDLAAWQTYAGGFDSASVGGDPLFVDSAAYDFTPDTGSPLIGAGDPTNSSATDFLGVARPNPPAIGAYEP